MKKKRMAVGAAMTALLPCLMAYSLIGETFHEVAGVGMLALFIAHHILNRAWFKGLFRGQYSPYRTFTTALNLLRCVVMACLPLSGIMMSKHLFQFLPTQGLSATARTVHLLLSYWGFALMSLHLGLHVDVMFKKKPKWLPFAAVLECVRSLAETKHATPAQISLAWMLGKKPYIVPIPGTRKPERLTENLGAADVALTADEITKIDKLLSGMKPTAVYGVKK